MVLLLNIAVDWMILWGIKWIFRPIHPFPTFSTDLAKEKIKEKHSEEYVFAQLEEIFKQKKNKII